MSLELDHLRAFLIVVEEGSMNKAADRLSIAQTAVGRQIRLLEESVGAALLERSSSGVLPTASGRLLIPRAKRILHEVADAKSEINNFNLAIRGTVCVALPTSLVDQLAADLVRTMRDRFPDVVLRIRDGHSLAILEWLHNRTAELALLPADESDASLQSVECLTQDFCFCCRAEKIAELPTSMSLAEALSYPLALSISPNRMRMLLDNAAKALGLTITPFVEAETTHTISLLVKEGLACTIRPYVGALPVTKDGLAHIRLSEPALQRRLSAVSSAQASLNPAGRATLSVLIELSRALNPM